MKLSCTLLFGPGKVQYFKFHLYGKKTIDKVNRTFPNSGNVNWTTPLKKNPDPHPVPTQIIFKKNPKKQKITKKIIVFSYSTRIKFCER